MLASCFQSRSIVIRSASRASGTCEPEQGERRNDARRKGRNRRISCQDRRREPEGAKDRRTRPREPSDDADVCRDALSAFETEPSRKDVTEERSEPRDQAAVDSEPEAGADGMADENGKRALEPVQQQRQRSKPLVPRAQHVRGADVSGADGSDVAKPSETGQQQAEGN